MSTTRRFVAQSSWFVIVCGIPEQLDLTSLDTVLLCFGDLLNGLVMTKYLLLIAFAFVVLWLWRKAQATRSGEQAPPVERALERMVKCAHCGVNQPVSESILAGGRYYCCAAHRSEAETGND
jgi:uncharacterized protein